MQRLITPLASDKAVRNALGASRQRMIAPGLEWLTRRELRLSLIGPTEVREEERLTEEEVARLRSQLDLISRYPGLPKAPPSYSRIEGPFSKEKLFRMSKSK